MTESTPNVYLIFGENEFEISQRVKALQESLCDPGLAAMNVTCLDGKTTDLNTIKSITMAMPFLADRRVVILENPLARISTGAESAFKKDLQGVPSSTVLILVEFQELTSEMKRMKGEFHWLEAWAEAAKPLAKVERYAVPKDLTPWIIERVKSHGGKITPSAAKYLATMTGAEPRQAEQEILKLLAYVNYKRTIEVDDVRHITSNTADEDIFALVDALGRQNTKQALALFQRLCEQQEFQFIFSMVVRQFRLLSQVREILDGSGKSDEVIKILKIHPFVAEKMIEQARNLRLDRLDQVMHQLVELDEAVKTSDMADRLALELFILDFSKV